MNRTTLGQVVLVVILVALSLWIFRRSSDRPNINLSPYQALGTVAGEATSKLVHHQGEVVVVIPDPGSDRDPIMDAQLAAFRDALKRAGKVTVHALETVKMDPFLSMRTGGAIPSDQFLSLLKKHAGVAALVMFIGFPILDEPDLANLKSSPMKRILISADVPGYETLVRQGILHLAILPRSRPADQTLPPAQTTRELFDQEYVILGQQ